MEKVKLPREVAEDIEHCRNKDFSNKVIIRIALDERGESMLRERLHVFTETRFDDFVSALYYGYEVEQTPEDKVRELYLSIDTDTPCGAGSRFAIKEALNILNIKIEGVNT